MEVLGFIGMAAGLLLLDGLVRPLIWRDLMRGRSRTSLMWYGAMGLLPVPSLFLDPVPLPLFYLLYFFSCALQSGILPCEQDNINHSIRLRFVMFASIHLTIVGGMALVSPDSLAQVLLNRSQLLCSIGMAALVFILLRMVAIGSATRYRFTVRPGQEREFRGLYRFLNVNLGYVGIQSVICVFPGTLTTDLGALLCGNGLSVVLIAGYLRSLMQILNVQGWEESNTQLTQSLGDSDSRLNQLRAHVHFDPLTQARSRMFLIQEVARLLDGRTPFSLVYVDLDGLKEVNDTRGHQAGDQYLQEFVRRVQGQLRSRDVVARLGGDEFILLLPHCLGEQALARVAQIQEQITQGREYAFSAGIADTTESDRLEGLISLADQRMYRQKQERGRLNVRF